MEFIKNIYLGNQIKNSKSIIKKLKYNQNIDKYCICIDEKSNSIIEIVHSHEIHKEVYKNKNYLIIGIANTKDEAKQIVSCILKDIYNEDNTLTDIKGTLLNSICKRGV